MKFQCKIALIDSICHSVSSLRHVRDAKCCHFACNPNIHSGVETVECGTDDHRLAVGSSFDMVTKWILDDEKNFQCLLI